MYDNYYFNIFSNFFSNWLISILKSTLETSKNFGVRPAETIAEIVATAVWDTVKTLSPFFNFNALKQISIASVAFPTATPYFTLQYLAKLFSNFFTSSPRM